VRAGAVAVSPANLQYQYTIFLWQCQRPARSVIVQKLVDIEFDVGRMVRQRERWPRDAPGGDSTSAETPNSRSPCSILIRLPGDRAVPCCHSRQAIARQAPHNPARHLEAGTKLSAGLLVITLCRRDLSCFRPGRWLNWRDRLCTAALLAPSCHESCPLVSVGNGASGVGPISSLISLNPRGIWRRGRGRLVLAKCSRETHHGSVLGDG
jgi:hypothetical protein